MEILDFLFDKNNNSCVNETNDDFDLTLPFTFFNDESSITLHFKKNEIGYYDIDDKGNTFRYLESIDANLENFADKVEIICTLFSLKIEENLVKGVVGYGTNQTAKQLYNFLQGLSHLSTLKYFE